MKFIVYRSRRPLGRQRWRWKLLAANGEPIANGNEAYANKADILMIVNKIKAFAIDTPLEVQP